jgi:hypothetical protein
MTDRLEQTLDSTAELVRTYADLIRAGQPPVVDDSPIADHVYAEDTTSDGHLRLLLAGGGPTVFLVFDRGTETAELVGSGWGETVHRSDDAHRSLATFAAAYAGR